MQSDFGKQCSPQPLMQALCDMRSFNASYFLNYPPDLAYAHWVSPKTIIPPATSLEIHAEVGGPYKLAMPGGISMIGEFIEVEPNRRLVYSWQWQGNSEITKVDVRFIDNSAGTEVKIAHSGFATEQSYKDHSFGWNSYMEGFNEYLSNVT
ncbi:SRPBCC domain-containing protein [Gammaproteobacteria bacterium]|nr:SRPBCC domain-containing protein [Gammaproteobacteria bacterium]